MATSAYAGPAARALSDSPNRELTEAELSARAALLPALRVLSAYLARAGWAATLADAQANGCAIELRTQGRHAVNRDPLDGVPLVVHVATLAAWGIGYVQTQDYRPRPPSLVMVTEALRFMGAVPAVTFRPVGEYPPTHPKVRALAGWWRCSPEVMRRIRMENYVPVLAPPRGRPFSATGDHDQAERLRPADLGSVRNARLSVAEDAAAMRRALIAYCDPDRATALAEYALTQYRPLCSRRAGRPSPEAWRINLEVRSVLVSVDALTVYAHTHRDVFGLVAPTRATVLAALESAHAEAPDVCSPAGTFSTPDATSVRSRVRWWRVDLAGIGQDEPDQVVMGQEVAQWLADSQVQAAASTQAAAAAAALSEGDPSARKPAGEHDDDLTQDSAGEFVFEIARREMTRAQRAERGLLYPHE